MPKKKTPLPENVVNAIEKWALKNCNTSEKASLMVDERISRVCKEIQETWTEGEEKLRKVMATEEYVAKSYRVQHIGTTQDKQFLPEKGRR